MYLVKISPQAEKDKKLLKAAGLQDKAKNLLNIIAVNPFQNPPRYEKLIGNLRGNYSRRINIQHRLVYDVIGNIQNIIDTNGNPYEGIVRVKTMWGHYE